MAALRAHTVILLASIAMLAGCGGDDDRVGDAGVRTDGGGVDAGLGPDGGGGALCSYGCAETLMADCSMGPMSMDECLTDCAMLRAGMCAAQFAAYQTCGFGETVTCDASGLPTVVACTTERNAFIACLSM